MAALLRPLLPYLMGGAGVLTLGSLAVSWWAWDERDEARQARLTAETSLADLRALRAREAEIAGLSAELAARHADTLARIDAIQFPKTEVRYVVPPAPGCPEPRLSTVRLRNNAARLSAELSAAVPGADGAGNARPIPLIAEPDTPRRRAGAGPDAGGDRPAGGQD